MSDLENEYPGEDLESTVAVIHGLRMGLGVEDIAATGVCSAAYARRVIRRLRDDDMLNREIGIWRDD